MSFGLLVRKILSVRDERGRITSDRFRYSVRRAIRKMLFDVVGPVLDAGGGDGILFDPEVSSLSGITTVLDFDMDALKVGSKAYSGRGTFLCGDITGMPLRDGVFDAAVCIGTFYNFPGPEIVQKGIDEMARVTDHDGRVIVEFRNADNPIVALAYRHAEKYDPSLNGLPLNAYTIKDAEQFMNRAGLVVKRVKLIGIPIKPLALGFIVEAVHSENEEKQT